MDQIKLNSDKAYNQLMYNIDEQVDIISKKFNIYNNMLSQNINLKQTQSPRFPNINESKNQFLKEDQFNNNQNGYLNIPESWELIKRNTELNEKVKSLKNTYVP